MARTRSTCRPLDQLNHANARLAPGPGAFAAVGEEALVADRARLHVEHLCDTRRKQLFVGDRPQVDHAAVAMGAGESRVDLLADLVAAGAGARADHSHHVSPPANVAQSTHTLLEHAAGEPAPAGVKCRHGSLRAEHHRDAVGGEHHRGQVRSRNRVTVGLESGLTGGVLALEGIAGPWALEGLTAEPWALAVCEDPSHDGAVYLIATHQTLHTECRAQALAGFKSMLCTLSTDAGHVALSASRERGKAASWQLEELSRKFARLHGAHRQQP